MDPSPISGRGFSLLELLVAIAIMAVVLAVALPVITSDSRMKLSAAARDIATALRQTRLLAQNRSAPAALIVDVDKRSIFVNESNINRTIPSDITIEMITAESELTGDNSGGIRFFPDGSSTGGQITLWQNKQWIRIDIEWLTGKIRQNEYQ